MGYWNVYDPASLTIFVLMTLSWLLSLKLKNTGVWRYTLHPNYFLTRVFGVAMLGRSMADKKNLVIKKSCRPPMRLPINQ